MQLTRFADLGLRVLMYLTQPERSTPVTIVEIATQFNVPANHLTKVVHRLGQIGWIQTQRGRNGGLRLSSPPSEIRIGDVIRQMEGDAPLIDCDGLDCTLAGGCGLRGALGAAQRAFYESLNRHTLADVTKPPTSGKIATLHRMYQTQHGLTP